MAGVAGPIHLRTAYLCGGRALRPGRVLALPSRRLLPAVPPGLWRVARRPGRQRAFAGQPCWGQFVDHRGAVKPALRAHLFAHLATVDLLRLWAAFPVPTYTVQAPMQAFYDLYQIGGQP